MMIVKSWQEGTAARVDLFIPGMGRDPIGQLGDDTFLAAKGDAPARNLGIGDQQGSVHSEINASLGAMSCGAIRTTALDRGRSIAIGRSSSITHHPSGADSTGRTRPRRSRGVLRML